MPHFQVNVGRQYGKQSMMEAVITAWEKAHPGQTAHIAAVTRLEHKNMTLLGKTDNGYNVYGTVLHEAVEALVNDQSPVESALAQGWAAYQAAKEQARQEEARANNPLSLSLRETADLQKLIIETDRVSSAALTTIIELFLEISPVAVLQDGTMGEYLYLSQHGWLSHYIEKQSMLMVLGGRPIHLPQGRYDQQVLQTTHLQEFYNLISNHVENVLNFGKTGDFLKTRYIAESPEEWLDLRYVAAGLALPRRGDSIGRFEKRMDRMQAVVNSPSSVSNPPPIEAPTFFDRQGKLVYENPGQTISSSFVPSATSRPSWMTVSSIAYPAVLPPTLSGIAKMTCT